MLVLPCLASAQAVNTSASVQQSFVTELQSLQQELASLESTINAMIAAAGGTASSSISTSAAVSSNTPSTPPLPEIALPSIGESLNTSPDFPGEDLSSLLLQTIAAIAPTSTFTVATSAAAAVATSTTSGPSNQNVATQLDPSCISGLFAEGAQCDGLYYCNTGTANSYWSATACINQ
jgi:hypothetical protein